MIVGLWRQRLHSDRRRQIDAVNLAALVAAWKRVRRSGALGNARMAWRDVDGVGKPEEAAQRCCFRLPKAGGSEEQWFSTTHLRAKLFAERVE